MSDSLAATLQARQRELAPHFKPQFLQRDSAVFQFRFEQGDPFQLRIKGTGFDFEAGEHDAPTLTLLLDTHETCFDLLTGRIDGMQAFMDGAYRSDGNIVLSQLLLYLFKADDPTIAYQVQD